MNILIFTPTWIGADGCEAMRPECRASIEAQQITGDHRWLIGLENPEPAPHHSNVLPQYRKARQAFLNGPWDALVTIEHDMALPDPGAIQRLIETEADVVYGIYVLRHGASVLSTWQYINDRNLGMSLSFYPAELAAAREAKAWRISGVGFGCTFIRRHVLERIEFHPGDDEHTGPDMSFARDCLREKFVSMGRFDLPVLHLGNGQWLHPYERSGMGKYIAAQNVNLLIDGNSIRLEAGQEYDLPDNQAHEFVRGGYLTAVNAPAQPAPVEQAIFEPIKNADALAQIRRPKRKTLSLS